MSSLKPVLISREEAATALGQGIKDIDRLINRGDLRTATEKGVKGGRPAKKVYEEDVLFIVQQARKTAKDAPSPSFAERYTPEDASRVFSALKSGTSVEDCVISLKIHPSAAMAIKRAWDEVKGQVTLSREELSRIEKLGLEGTFPIVSPDSLMDVVETAAKERVCTTCKGRGATVCKPCSLKVARQPETREARETSRVGMNGVTPEGAPGEGARG